MKVIDAYSHFGVRKDLPQELTDPKILEKFPDVSVEECAKKWEEVMNKHELEKTIFLAVRHGSSDFMNYVKGSNKFVGVSTINPNKSDFYEIFMRDVKQGVKGLTLYPVWHAYDVADPKLEKVYQYCSDHGLPITIHFGVSALLGDMRYANPILFSPIATKYPKLKMIIAHFGAGHFNEALMLMYKNPNIYFDTSGTNNWLDHSPFGWDLKDVFAKALKAISSKNIIWGSDSYHVFSGEGYRSQYKDLQQKIVRGLCNEEEERNIFYNNVKSVYNL